MLRWDEETGAVSVFRHSAGHTNGNTLDRQGRLVTCEQGNRRVTRTEHDGTVTVLAERWQGKRLNSPNDAAVKSDGSIWFSDPDFGITSDYEGHRAPSEIGSNNVYRVDPATGEVRLVADCFEAPNGLVFSPDERRLFVSDTRAGRIRVFDVRDDGTLSTDRTFAEARGTARFDNLRFDDAGRLWAAAMDDGVHCYDPDGTLLGRLNVPERVANIAWAEPSATACSSPRGPASTRWSWGSRARTRPDRGAGAGRTRRAERVRSARGGGDHEPLRPLDGVVELRPQVFDDGRHVRGPVHHRHRDRPLAMLLVER
jgi:sugar lactone lactonase YvrE